MRLWRQFHVDQIAWIDLPTVENDAHDACFADEVTFCVLIQDCAE